MSLFDLSGQIIIVTGSSKGIGKAIAMRLAEQGAKIVISSRKQGPCEEVATEICKKNGSGAAIAVPANISSKDDLQNLVDETTRQLGAPTSLICNAATNPYYGPISGIADDQFRKILDNNVIANHWLIQMCLPTMLAQKQGSIVIVSSVGGFIGSGAIGAYNISKAADFQLARNLAVELGRHNVRVNCIAPGLVRTDFAKALWQDPERVKGIEAATPLARLGEPDDIAGAAAFLVSDASRFMTGQSIVIDGGATIANLLIS